MRQLTIVHIGGHEGEEYLNRPWLQNAPVLIQIFEPLPENVERMKVRFKDWANVGVQQGAMIDRDGVISFFKSDVVAESSVFAEKGNLINPIKRTVPAFKAERVLNGLIETGTDLAVWLNCEGSEFVVLPEIWAGNISQRIRFWHVNWHHDTYRLPQFAGDAAVHKRLFREKGIRNLSRSDFFRSVKEWVKQAVEATPLC